MARVIHIRVTFAGTYLLSPTFVLDAYVGWARLGTNIESPGLEDQQGLALGIPGTNGPAHYQGGYPRFSVTGYDTIGTPARTCPITAPIPPSTTLPI